MESDGLSQREEPLECKVCGPSEVECGTGEGAEIKTCPVWANAGCFSSEKIILANRRYSGTYNRGCSAIPTERSCQTVTVEKAGSIEVDRVSYNIAHVKWTILYNIIYHRYAKKPATRTTVTLVNHVTLQFVTPVNIKWIILARF